ncbi:hypothetical protein KDW77_gp35 [Mycobacterium phage Pinnie]|uniref:Uncharacterized protein n=1 Tax=Mycobacterium phage Pinnie TaxID=2517965 RepID=A0A482JDD4_9CAUD|nr:hypothetical protein KDW77_gp35 [Mycobacterium phage Pinnie]QBP30249.1 hypothetical protein SEA_PINNIE_35 [Mycobacterium phage Pinnie]
MSEDRVMPAEAMTPDVEEPLPYRPLLPYRRNPDEDCALCFEPAGRPCEPFCIARLDADEQLAHRDAVLDRTIDELDCTLGTVPGAPWAKRLDPDFVDLDPEDYRVVSCTIPRGRHRARPDYWRRVRRLRRVLIVAVVVLVAAVGALWASQRANAEWFDECPSGLSGVATPDTSCAFADNVRAAFYWQPGWTVIATSPVTGKFYTMQCSRTATDVWHWTNPKRCYGVNDAGAVLVVYIA